MCRYGFSPTIAEIKELVGEYIEINDLTIRCFKNGKPGKDWFAAFMKRNALSIKNAEMMSVARKKATENPWFIYEFYETLDKIVKEKKLTAAQIWNCDESGFPTDPSRCKAVTKRGEKAYRITLGAGRENTTTLATCNAAGCVMDPLIIYAGKNLQSSWRGNKALPDTMYSVSDSGWMTKAIFFSWFERFCDQITQRPLLLVFDGHLTHLSIDVIRKARAEDVTILKLPPHTTDLIQPLDVACFGPLKCIWERKLNEWTSLFGVNERIKKAQFANMLSEVWRQGLSTKNIIAGFEATGVFPVNKLKYPTNRFNPNLLKSYKSWDAAGRPESMKDVFGSKERSATTPRKSPRKPMQSPKQTSAKSLFSKNTPVSKDKPPTCTCEVCIIIGDVPTTKPTGKKWKPVWSLVDDDLPQASSTPVGTSANNSVTSTGSSFQELIMQRRDKVVSVQEVEKSVEGLIQNQKL